MGTERTKTKAADNARDELGEERVKKVEGWMTTVEESIFGDWRVLGTPEGIAKAAAGDFGPRAFFLIFDWLRLRGVTKEQAARTAELLVNHRAGRETP